MLEGHAIARPREGGRGTWDVCRPSGTLSFRTPSYPALPCRAIGCSALRADSRYSVVAELVREMRPDFAPLGRSGAVASGGFLWGLVEAEEVSFGVFECGDEAPARSDFGFRDSDGASGAGDFCHGVPQQIFLGGVDLDVVHEGLAGVPAGHESSVDAGVSVFGFDEQVVHVPGVGDLPAEGLFVEPGGALNVVCWDFKVNDKGLA